MKKGTKKTQAQAQLRLMDQVMTGGRLRVKAPKVLAEHKLTSAQVRDIGSKVVLRHIKGKGLGLTARKNLKPHTRIGVYGGRVFSAREHERLTSLGATTGKYAIDFYTMSPDGKVRDDLIMDPGSGADMDPSHGNVLAAFINEPAMGQVPNVVWVRNYASGTMELWTTSAVRAGAELTACYGDGYPRAYKTPCTRNPGVLHRVDSSAPGTRPRPV
jgi:hypothetical protein